jgi:dTMP kinase
VASEPAAGRFVVLEGLDGAGTTTQARLLAAALRATGRTVLQTFEPTNRAVGRLIRQVLRSDPGAPGTTTLPYLFAADRHDHLVGEIEPALSRGEFVISDRYYPSSMAYQSLEAPLARIVELNREFRSPDALIFLRVPVEVALARIHHRAGAADAPPAEVYEKREALVRVASAYDQVLALLRRRGERVIELDGTRPLEDVAAMVWAAAL